MAELLKQRNVFAILELFSIRCFTVRPEPVEGYVGRFDKLTANGLILQATNVIEQQL